MEIPTEDYINGATIISCKVTWDNQRTLTFPTGENKEEDMSSHKKQKLDLQLEFIHTN